MKGDKCDYDKYGRAIFPNSTDSLDDQHVQQDFSSPQNSFPSDNLTDNTPHIQSPEDNSAMPMSAKGPSSKPKSSKHKFNVDDRKLVTAIRKLYKGLNNPLNNCLFNAAVASYNHLFGSYRILNDSDMSNDLLKIFRSVNISSGSDTLSSEDLTVFLNNLFSTFQIFLFLFPQQLGKREKTK